jgi:cytidine deaminase
VTSDELLAQADAAARNAYAPYSNYLVGAAVLARDGRVFAGGNVENAAYPLGICAEPSAIARAAGEGLRPGDLEAIAITASPCGGCRQWMAEFQVGRVLFPIDGELAERTPAELLPDTFEF